MIGLIFQNRQNAVASNWRKEQGWDSAVVRVSICYHQDVCHSLPIDATCSRIVKGDQIDGHEVEDDPPLQRQDRQGGQLVVEAQFKLVDLRICLCPWSCNLLIRFQNRSYNTSYVKISASDISCSLCQPAKSDPGLRPLRRRVKNNDIGSWTRRAYPIPPQRKISAGVFLPFNLLLSVSPGEVGNVP